MDEDRNTYQGTWGSLTQAAEAIVKLAALGYTDVTLTSVPIPARDEWVGGMNPLKWSFVIDALQRTPADALKEDSERRRASVNATDRDYADLYDLFISEGLSHEQAERLSIRACARFDRRGRLSVQAKCCRCAKRDADDQASLCVLCLNEPTLADERRELEAQFAMDDAAEATSGF